MIVDDTNIMQNLYGKFWRTWTFGKYRLIDPNSINKWLLTNEVTVNLTKKEFIVFGYDNKIRNLVKPCDLRLGNHIKKLTIVNSIYFRQQTGMEWIHKLLC